LEARKMKKLYLGFMAICLAALVSCFSPWEGGDGMIRLEFSGVSRAFVPLDNGQYNLFVITLTGPGGRELRQTVTLSNELESGSRIAQIAVTPGDWIVSVREFREEAPEEVTLERIGFSEPVTVRAGQSVGAPVRMMFASEVSSAEALVDLDLDTVLVLTDSIGGVGPFSINAHITLISDEDFTISRAPASSADANHNLFQINQGGSLTLGMPGMSGSITIDGAGIEAENSLIYIATGTLVMHSGVTLTGGILSEEVISVTGSAVTVSDNGAFIMHGGTITGNQGGRGAVVVSRGRMFDRRGGTIISGNTPRNEYFEP
jgi:hypothetical protein